MLRDPPRDSRRIKAQRTLPKGRQRKIQKEAIRLQRDTEFVRAKMISLIKYADCHSNNHLNQLLSSL